MALSEHASLKSLAQLASPLSFAHIKLIEPLNGKLASFLKAFAKEDVYCRQWEFDGNAVIDDFWTFDADATATGFAVPATQELAGVLTGATGATDNGALSMIGVPVVSGDKKAYFHTHFSLSAITDVQFEVGLVDAITDRTLPAVSDIDTPANGSNGAADFALVHMDTDQTLQTAALVVDGSTAGMDCTKSNLLWTPTAATMHCVRIWTDANDVVWEIDHSRTYRKSISGEFEGGTLLAPWLYFRTRTTTTRTVKVDMVELMVER